MWTNALIGIGSAIGVMGASLLALLSIPPRKVRWLEWLQHDQRKGTVLKIAVCSLAAGALAVVAEKNRSSSQASIFVETPPEFDLDPKKPSRPSTPRATTDSFERDLHCQPAEREREARHRFREAQSHFMRGAYEVAIPEYRESIAACYTPSAVLNLGIALRNASLYMDAASAFATGLEYARKKSERQFEAAFQLQLGSVNTQLGREPEAEEHLTAALMTFRDLDDQVGQADALLGLATFFRRVGHPATANLFIADAKGLYRLSHNTVGLANLAVYQGVDMVKHGKCEAALPLFREALKDFQQIDYLGDQARARITIGLCLSVLNQHAEGEQQLAAARDLASASGDSAVEGAADIALAHLLVREGKFDAARIRADAALGLGRSFALPKVREYALLILAETELASTKGNLDEGLKYVAQALDIAVTTNEAAGKVNALCIQGKIYLKKADAAKALSSLEPAVSEARQSGMLQAIGDCLTALGDARKDALRHDNP